jgi:hypothetical protein
MSGHTHTHIYTNIHLQKYAGSKQKSSKIMKMKMFAILDKAKPDTENIKRLKLGGGHVYDRSSV